MVTSVGLPPVPKRATKGPALGRVPIWVRWVDSSSRAGWQDMDGSYIPLMTVETIGWLVQEDKESITLALSRVFDGSSSAPYAHLINIPLCAIKDRKTFKWALE